MEQQLARRLQDNLADLPAARNKPGGATSFTSMSSDIPVSWLVTAASRHDGQAAIPLAQMTNERVTSLYDLADAAYDATAIGLLVIAAEQLLKLLC